MRWSLTITSGFWGLLRCLCDQLVVERYLLHPPNTSLRPVGCRNGTGGLLSVGDCRTAVCSSLYWSLGGLRQSAASKVADRPKLSDFPLLVADWSHSHLQICPGLAWPFSWIQITDTSGTSGTPGDVSSSTAGNTLKCPRRSALYIPPTN